MGATPNNTLPPQWSENTKYTYGDLVSYAGIIYRCIQSYPDTWSPHNPATDTDREWWMPLDIYIKDETVMHHASYSGDENFWERDNIYIDSSGYVYLNNENTGINVRGPEGHATIDFSVLTPEQIEQLKGDRGERGPVGPEGPEGPRGPEGYVTLTAEQIAILKGEPGKSAYQSWLDQGHTGTEADFVAWLRSGIIKLDTELSPTSPNGITNAAITQAFQSYRTQVTELVHQLQSRVQDLENRLQTIYNGDTVYFRFGITPEGKYGYYLSETSAVVPFSGNNQESLSSSNVFRSDPQIFQQSYGWENELVHNTLISSQLTEPTSLEGDPSGIQEDPTTLYATNVEFENLEDAFDTYIYLFKNNKFTEEVRICTYSMNHPEIISPLISANEESIEGIYFPPSADLNNKGNTLYIEVEPINEEDTIRYQIGYYSNELGQLPDLVSPGTYREGYENGSFNNTTTIRYSVQSGKGYYFASLQQSEYRIKSIYIG